MSLYRAEGLVHHPRPLSISALAAGQTDSIAYKEHYAKVATPPHDSRSETPPVKSCALIVKAQCPHCETNVVKVIYCGKEWCPECGQDWSVVHQRKFSRLLPKARQMSGFGYFVIEFPDRYRKLPGWVYSKRGLRMASSRVVDVLAGDRKGRRGRVGGFFPRGFLRWHWFGDRRAGKYNPHANVIVEGGYIPPERLGKIKARLSKALLCPDLIVHYSYRKSEGEMIHSLKYITRATFLDRSWDDYMAHQLHGFRNIRAWGNWKGQPVWSSEGQEVYLAIDELERGKCPDCGSQMKWQRKALSLHYLRGWQDMGLTTALGGGYFKLRFPSRAGGPGPGPPAGNLEKLRCLG